MNSTFSFAHISRILFVVFLVWLVVFIFIGGPLFRRNDEQSDHNDEVIMARLTRLTNELNSLRNQNDELKSLLHTYLPLENQISRANNLLSKNILNEAKFDDGGGGGTAAGGGGGGVAGHYVNNLENYDSASASIMFTAAGGGGAIGSERRFVEMFKFENTRRRLLFTINELWYYLNSKHEKFNVSLINEFKYSLIYDMKQIERRDDEWRKERFQQLSEKVQKVFHNLQNPIDCKNARKLICDLNKGCGFACQLHHVAYCFTVALGTNRTMILESKTWRYAKGDDSAIGKDNYSDGKPSTPKWNSVFEPISSTCLYGNGSASHGVWKGVDDKTQVVKLPIIDSLRPRPDFLPLAIPEEIAPQLEMIHGTPSAWFIGQITRFLFKPTREMNKFIETAKERMKFTTPIVGVHVRRTDKVGTEASLHYLSEYMRYVEHYYDQLDLTKQRSGINNNDNARLVYLATDEPKLWTTEVPEFEKKGYKFIGDKSIAFTAGLGKRYSYDSLKNIILDIWLLSETDHLVCTFSSQVCRLAYELMQTRGSSDESSILDWSDSFNSLDDIYYFGGQNGHHQVAILDHHADQMGEISFDRGEIIGIAGNHWNGFSMGSVIGKGKRGLYPGFKTREQVAKAKFKAFQTQT